MARASGARTRTRCTTARLSFAWVVAVIGTTSCAPQRPTIAPATPAARERAVAQEQAPVQPPAAPTQTAAPELRADSRESAVAPELGPISSKAAPKIDASWTACGETMKSKGLDPVREVAALSNACAAVTHMKLVGTTLTGKQSDAEAPQSYPFQADANRCYRVYTQADGRIESLNVAIVDSAGIVAGQGTSAGSTVIVLRDGAVCFKESGAATVVVSVGRGGGAYALQVWGD